MTRRLVVILGTVALLASWGALGVTIWWAKTTVATVNLQLDVERANVKAVKSYAGDLKKAFDARTQEVGSLRAECQRLKQAPAGEG
jgi:hypothetical protein